MWESETPVRAAVVFALSLADGRREMATIVWGACTAHTAAMNRLPPGTDPAQADRVFAAFKHLQRTLVAARPDALVVVGTDHFMTFNYDAAPTFAIGTGDAFQSWGEASSPDRRFRGHDRSASSSSKVWLRRILTCCALTKCGSITRLRPRWDSFWAADLPVVPIYVNCTTTPLPSHARCRAFGQALGGVLQRRMPLTAVAVLGTGGLSHWIGVLRTGDIDENFDQDFLDRFVVGDVSGLDTLDIPAGLLKRPATVRPKSATGSLPPKRSVRGDEHRRLADEPVRSGKPALSRGAHA